MYSLNSDPPGYYYQYSLNSDLTYCRPVDSLCMTDRHEASEDMFRLPPVSLLRTPPCEEADGGLGAAGGAGGAGEVCVGDQDTESEMGEGEEDPSDPLLSSEDAGSTQAANLLYLSDQV